MPVRMTTGGPAPSLSTAIATLPRPSQANSLRNRFDLRCDLIQVSNGFPNRIVFVILLDAQLVLGFN